MWNRANGGSSLLTFIKHTPVCGAAGHSGAHHQDGPGNPQQSSLLLGPSVHATPCEELVKILLREHDPPPASEKWKPSFSYPCPKSEF